MTTTPNCKCHRVPMWWHANTATGGGSWDCHPKRIEEKARYRNSTGGMQARAAYNVRTMLQSTGDALRDAVTNLNGRVYAPSDGS